MENVGDCHHKHCLSRMAASSKRNIKIKKYKHIYKYLNMCVHKKGKCKSYY